MSEKELQKYLETKKISQRDFAEAARISPALLSRYLSGKRKLSIDAALRVSKLSGLSLDALFRAEIEALN
jgi:transcriptional regulator with XRE-family HTH domain